MLPLVLALMLGRPDPTAAVECRHLYGSPHPDGAPSWSPDAETIAFSSSMSGDWEIYTMDVDGAEPVNFSRCPEAVDIFANWSPAGEWIVFTSRRENGLGENDMDLWIQSLDGDSLRCLTDHPGYDNFAAFDPGGTRIAFSSDRSGETAIWVMPVADPDQAYQVSSGLDACFHSAWSPDGRWIAFDAPSPDNPLARHLYLVPAEGGPPQEVLHGLLVSCDPSWSPDGRYLAFGGGEDTLYWDLWLWDFQTESLVQLTNTPFPEQSPLWNAGGDEIVYAAVIEKNKDIWIACELPVDSLVVRPSKTLR